MARGPIDPYVFDWETEHLFEEAWTYVGHWSEIENAGDQKALAIGKESVLVLRDRQGRLRGWHNICRHRGHELLEIGTVAHAGAIRCPYHAWVYGLDGDLRATPRFGDPAGFEYRELSLSPVGSQQWLGSVFADPSGRSEPLGDVVGSYRQIATARGMERMTLTEMTHEEVSVNWKTFALEFLGAPGPGEERTLGLFPNLYLSERPDSVHTYRLEPMGPLASRIERRVLVGGNSDTPYGGTTPAEEIARFQVALAHAYTGPD